MKKLLLILGITNFIAIETSLIISCSSKLTKPIERATNPSQCGNSCKLEFASIQNSYVFKWPALGFVWNTDDKLDDLPQDVSAFTIPEGGSMSGYVFNFYKKNMTKIVNVNGEYDKYYIDKVVNVKITILKASALDRYDRRAGYIITSFSAEMPPLPEKDNEQPNPRAGHLKT